MDRIDSMDQKDKDVPVSGLAGPQQHTDIDLTTCRAEKRPSVLQIEASDTTFMCALIAWLAQQHPTNGETVIRVMDEKPPAPSTHEIVMLELDPELERRIAEALADPVLPDPDEDGVYHWPDGSLVLPADIDKWCAYRSGSRWVEDSEGWLARFDTPLDGARALQELREGPGAENA